MDKIVVTQSKLKGSVKISGAKNAALPIMAATLLTDEKCIINNVPDLADIRTMAKILEGLGKDISFEKNSTVPARLVISPNKKRKGSIAPYNLVRTMRASFCCLGPLLAKRKKAKVAFPGGCVIGARPVDLHLKGFIELGVDISVEKGYCIAQAKMMVGKHIYLGGPFGSSVLATANVMMAAVLAQGVTVLEHAACEPEIENLGNVLNAMGAKVFGAGTPLVTIEGVKSLSGCEVSVIPDRIEAGTFLAAGLVTGSSISIEGLNPFHLTSVLEVVKAMGAKLKIRENSLDLEAPPACKAGIITTLPYPGFPTDLQAQFMVCFCLAQGISLVTEKVYPDRFMHVAELNRMGAGIQKNGPYAIVEGKKQLYGAEVMASDLRASAALLIAGLAAQDKTRVLRVYHIDRGYEYVVEKFRGLGANIRREKQ